MSSTAVSRELLVMSSTATWYLTVISESSNGEVHTLMDVRDLKFAAACKRTWQTPVVNINDHTYLVWDSFVGLIGTRWNLWWQQVGQSTMLLSFCSQAGTQVIMSWTRRWHHPTSCCSDGRRSRYGNGATVISAWLRLLAQHNECSEVYDSHSIY